MDIGLVILLAVNVIVIVAFGLAFLGTSMLHTVRWWRRASLRGGHR